MTNPNCPECNQETRKSEKNGFFICTNRFCVKMHQRVIFDMVAYTK